MKKLMPGLLLLIPVYFIIQGCNKLAEQVVSNGQITATKISVKINEPDTLVITGAKSTDVIQWVVSPSGFNSITTSSSAAALIFTQAGSYSVKASVNGVYTQSLTITVSTAVYTAPVSNVTIPLTGDQIGLVPALYKSTKADSTYIYFTAQTTNAYCVAAKLNYTNLIDAGGYQLAFNSVTQYNSCSGSTAVLRTVINFKQSTPLLANGTYPLSVSLNGVNYTGSVVVSTANIIFNWNYSSGVTILPKQLNR